MIPTTRCCVSRLTCSSANSLGDSPTVTLVTVGANCITASNGFVSAADAATLSAVQSDIPLAEIFTLKLPAGRSEI